MSKRLASAMGVFGALLLAHALGVTAQETPPTPLHILSDSLAGRDSFDLYCATCHGSGGRGDGPVAAALKTRPADLTLLARRNSGSFPRDRVLAFVTGTARVPSAHGTTEMPIWGPLFRAFETDTRARVRLDNLVSYVQTLQAPSTAVNDAGSQLFRTYCASCHGADARGSGPMAPQLRGIPPDLTSFAARNGGVFPGERVHRIVEGRDVASHGDREMPVWGDAFRRTRGGLSEDAIKARIGAIVDYLERIQERGTR
jgi:mono/diheme cytochrome c family protein